MKSFSISSRYEDLIKKFVNDDFNVRDFYNPESISSTCKLTLNEHEKEIFQGSLQDVPIYKDIVLPKSTRRIDDLCGCYICEQHIRGTKKLLGVLVISKNYQIKSINLTIYLVL